MEKLRRSKSKKSYIYVRIILALDISKGEGGAYLDAISAGGESAVGADFAEYEFNWKRDAKLKFSL